MPRPLTGNVGGPHLDGGPDVTNPPLGHVGLQHEALDLPSTAVLSALPLLQRQLRALLAHAPRLQGLELPARPGQSGDGGQTRAFWPWNTGTSTHQRLLLAADRQRNHAASTLATKAPASLTMFNHAPCQIHWSCVEAN